MANHYLPPEIIAEILSWLPFKSMCQFKCVSKTWLSLISSPKFSKLRFEHAPQRPQLNTQKLLISHPFKGFYSLDYESCFGNKHALVELDFPFKTQHYQVNFIGSCNGLVCLPTHDFREFLLWNPSTGAYRRLRGILSGSRVYTYGFGYDSSSDDYKILFMTECWSLLEIALLETELNVFSLKSNSWNRIAKPQYKERIYGVMAVFYNGALYWTAGSKIYGFDLVTEKYSNDVPLLSLGIETHLCSTLNLVVLGEQLCLSCYSYRYGSFMLWIMKESWSTPTGDLVDFDDSLYPAGRDLNLLCVTKKGAYISMKKRYELIMYNPEDNTHQQFTIFCRNHCAAIPYKETLISPYAWSEY